MCNHTKIQTAIALALLVCPGGCDLLASDQRNPARAPARATATSVASAPSGAIRGFRVVRVIDPKKALQWKVGWLLKLRGKDRKIWPATTNTANLNRLTKISPNQEWLVWGDGEGNVFGWSLKLQRLFVIHDATVSRLPSEEENGSKGIHAISFVSPEKVCWLDDDWHKGSAVLKKDKVAQVQVGRFGKGGALWSGDIVGDAIVVCTFNRHRFLSNECVLEKYDLASGKYLSTAKIYPMKRGNSHFVRGTAISADQKKLAIISMSNAGVVGLEPFKLHSTVDVESGRSIVFSPDASQVAIGTHQDRLVIADAATGRVVRELKTRTSATVLAYSPQGDLWYESGWHIYRLRAGAKEPEEMLGLDLDTMDIRPVAMVFVNKGRGFFFRTKFGEIVEYSEAVPQGTKGQAKPGPSSKPSTSGG